MFREILLELLQTTKGSLGALFLDWEGECVEVFTERPLDAGDHDLQVIGAYQGIYRTQLRKLCDDMQCGQPLRLMMQFTKIKVLTCDLKDGYYLVLVVDEHANEGVAWRRLATCRERLLAQI